jgi:hypothetical protein
MMMVILTKPEGHDAGLNGDVGPLRQLQRDLDYSHQRIDYLERDLKQLTNTVDILNAASTTYGYKDGSDKYTLTLTDAKTLEDIFNKFGK